MTQLESQVEVEASVGGTSGAYAEELGGEVDGSGARRGRIWVAVLVGVVMLAGFLLLRAGAGSGGEETVEGAGAPEAGAAPDAGYPSGDEIEAATELLERQKAEGWVPYGNVSAIDGSPTPPDLWVEPGVGPIDADGKKPVYDAPNGVIVGYVYSNLGYVPIELNDTFDFRAARIEKFGCDDTAPNITCPTDPQP